MPERLSSSFSAALALPRRLAYPSSWVGHWPFGYWLAATLAPRQTVELGTHSGNSLFCFAQSLSAHGATGQIAAVDTWQGDDHAGQYSEDIYAAVSAHAQEFYPHTVRLMRTTFDQALQDVAPGSVDLLHIDGLHTYEAVRHDFESWAPKCAPNAVVLFHDTQVRRDDFGVWKFWAEVTSGRPHFEFLHSNGLGVLCLGNASSALLQEFFACANHPADCESIRQFFSVVGQLMIDQADAQEQVRAAKREVAAYASGYQAERELRLHAQDQVQNIYGSKSWRVTAPLRTVSRWLAGRSRDT